jgi:hypothetical protein
MTEANSSSILDSIWSKLSEQEKSALLTRAIAGNTTVKSVSERPLSNPLNAKKTKIKHEHTAITREMGITTPKKVCNPCKEYKLMVELVRKRK